jgi:4-carboxymuconolactone decarboxylase
MVVRFGQELWQQHQVSEPTFQTVLARFGKQGVTELTALIGYYGMVACVLSTFEVPLDPDVPPLLPQ